MSVDRGPRRLAGVLATTTEGRAALSRALVQTRGPLVVWADTASAPFLPPLPEGSDVTLVLIGLGVPLDALSRTRNLAGLHVQACGTRASDLRPIAHLTGLRTLVLPTGPRVTSLRRLARMRQLTELSIALSDSVDDLSPLAGLTSLHTLHLDCATAPDLTALGALPRLRSLSLAGEISGGRLRGLDRLTRLECLSLKWRGGPVDLAALARLRNLRVLRLADCRNVGDLHPLGTLGNLEVLSLSDCGRVVSIAPITRLPKLRSLQLDLCDSIGDIEGLRALERRGVQLTLDSLLRRRLDAARDRARPPRRLFLAPK
jgi:hypothetical protein